MLMLCPSWTYQEQTQYPNIMQNFFTAKFALFVNVTTVTIRNI